LRCSGRETDPLEESLDFTGRECFRQCPSLERSRAPSFIVEGLRGAFFNGLGCVLSHAQISLFVFFAERLSSRKRPLSHYISLSFQHIIFSSILPAVYHGGFPSASCVSSPHRKGHESPRRGGWSVHGIGVAMSRGAQTSRGAEPVLDGRHGSTAEAHCTLQKKYIEMHVSLHQGEGHKQKSLVRWGLGTEAGRKD
jgi:hypothetical protein